jgi:hypothetical protein
MQEIRNVSGILHTVIAMNMAVTIIIINQVAELFQGVLGILNGIIVMRRAVGIIIIHHLAQIPRFIQR